MRLAAVNAGHLCAFNRNSRSRKRPVFFEHARGRGFGPELRPTGHVLRQPEQLVSARSPDDRAVVRALNRLTMIRRLERSDLPPSQSIRSAAATDIQFLVERGIAWLHGILAAQDIGWHV